MCDRQIVSRMRLRPRCIIHCDPVSEQSKLDCRFRFSGLCRFFMQCRKRSIRVNGQGLERTVCVDFFAEYAAGRKIAVIDLDFLFLTVQNRITDCLTAVNCIISCVLRIFQRIKDFAKLNCMVVVIQNKDKVSFRRILRLRLFIRCCHGDIIAVFVSFIIQHAVDAAPFRNCRDRILKFRAVPCLFIARIICIQHIVTAAHLNQIEFHCAGGMPNAERQTGKRQIRIIFTVNGFIVIRFGTKFIETRNRGIQRVVTLQFRARRFVLRPCFHICNDIIRPFGHRLYRFRFAGYRQLLCTVSKSGHICR